MEVAMKTACRAQLTRVVNEANVIIDSELFNVKDALVQVVKIKSARENVKSANEKASSFISEDQMDNECVKILEYDEKAVVAIARLEQCIAEVNSQGNMALGASAENMDNVGQQTGELHQPKMSVRLPKLELIKFSGNYHEWPAFWEQFESAIHSNLQLDDASKFSYLKSVLYGNASITIQGLTTSKNSYNDAIQLLKDEYGNKECIIDSYIQKLLDINPVKNRTDISALRKLYNVTSKIMKSLQRLGIEPGSYGMMVKSIILKALPLSMRIEYNKKQATTDIGNDNEETASRNSNMTHESSGSSSEASYEDKVLKLLQFIKLEVDSVEQANILSGEKSSGKSQSTDSFKRNRFKPKEHNEFTAAGLFTSVNEHCLFCKSKDHMTTNCTNSAVTLAKKKDILKSSGRCFRCTKSNHSSRNCRTNIRCNKCSRKHAMTMCDPDFIKNNSATNRSSNNNEQSNERESGATALFSNNGLSNVLLQTACAQVLDSGQSKTYIRLIIDGGSQLTFIKECVSRQLNLPIEGTHKLSIMCFGKKELAPARLCNRVKLTIRGVNSNENITINAIEVPEICFDTLAVPSCDNSIINEFSKEHSLADICPDNAEQVLPGISVLVGADYYWKIVTGEIKKLSEYQTAVNTYLGWTIHGRSCEYGFSLNVNVANIFQVQTVNDDFDLKKFWDVEAIGINDTNVMDHSTKRYIEESIHFNENRYTVALPWKSKDIVVESNFNGALSRAKSLTSKLIRMGGLVEYDKAVREYFENDCAESANSVISPKVYYMPHRPVYRYDKDTTRIRVVFDASAHAPGMPSLNDLLSPGENLVPLLLKVLINFRIGNVALIADIEKAFLQIEINENDRDALRFLWYESSIEDNGSLPEIVSFRMKRVTFGVTSSPFILAATLTKHLDEQNEGFKKICDIMSRSFYVDDLVAAVDTSDEASELYFKSQEIMKKASMNLRKWATNNVHLRRTLLMDNEKASNPVKKVLGIRWCTLTDQLNIDVNSILSTVEDHTGQQGITKRKVLQTIAKVYDPLGLLSPFIIRAKILMQQIWIEKYDWDSILSNELTEVWIKWENELLELKEYWIPRCVVDYSKDHTELHIFSDASPKAYGAVAYLKVTTSKKNKSCNILVAKNRVAPLNLKGDKTLTIPKLELTGALCAARLQDFILKVLCKNIDEIFLWTDSKISMHWIKGKSSKWKPYVAHRVAEIQKLTKGEWRHCPGVENPADLLSRGINVKAFVESKLWLHGPEWLLKDKEFWPNDGITEPEQHGIFSAFAVQVEVNGISGEPLFPFDKFSNFDKILRITAYVRRFIARSRNLHETLFDSVKVKAEELIQSEFYWIKVIQAQYFKAEISALSKGHIIERQSSILSLNPFLDDQGVLRLGSRLQEAALPYDTKYPIILPKKSILTTHVILRIHGAVRHGGVNITLTNVRKKYWIIQGRQRIKAIIKTCIVCKRLRGKPASEPFAPLPRSRLDAVAPFKVTGVDFAGPLYVINENGRLKVYIMLLTCAVIRAIHLELVPDLTTESCIRALRRFISRRGVPDIIYSDNAKTFKRAALELNELTNILWQNEVQGLAAQQRIKWRFIVERASWWGGFWERLVKSVKDALKLSLGKRTIGFDELQTVLTEVEATINSRPLTYIGNEPDDLLILTPGHFLLGENYCGFQIDLTNPIIKRDNILQAWKARNDILTKFWKIWSCNYLQQLRSVHNNVTVKQQKLQVGDLVLLYEQNLPRLMWKMVRITKTFIGRDEKVRACEIVTSNGLVMRRPIQLLYPLEISAAREDVENNA